ncbi:hypothetical protein [Georgenia sp. AZ-5]|uniref:hypothetical protein n=1 Tax=Georgenia sp. AZ-5 TaxID=3367526 RepID=UPI0037545740
MGRYVVCNIMSLDGYYEGPRRNVMAMNMDEAFDAYNLERIALPAPCCSAGSPTRGSAPTGPGSRTPPAIPATVR